MCLQFAEASASGALSVDINASPSPPYHNEQHYTNDILVFSTSVLLRPWTSHLNVVRAAPCRHAASPGAPRGSPPPVPHEPLTRPTAETQRISSSSSSLCRRAMLAAVFGKVNSITDTWVGTDSRPAGTRGPTSTNQHQQQPCPAGIRLMHFSCTARHAAKRPVLTCHYNACCTRPGRRSIRPLQPGAWLPLRVARVDCPGAPSNGGSIKARFRDCSMSAP